MIESVGDPSNYRHKIAQQHAENASEEGSKNWTRIARGRTGFSEQSKRKNVKNHSNLDFVQNLAEYDHDLFFGLNHHCGVAFKVAD